MNQGENPRISIIIPAYNEEAVIGDILDELNKSDYHEIIVVDDGSSDNTAQIAGARGARVICHPYNIGNGGAVKTGIRAATGDIIVMMDADGQHPPDNIPHLLSYLGDYDMVVGARTAESEAQWHRRFANTIFNRYATYIVGYPVEDLTSGFRVFKAPLVKRFVYLLPNGFSYPSTITIAFFRSGYRVRYEPIVSPARVGKSKIRPMSDGFRFLLTITRLGTMFVPLKIFLPVSFVFGLVGVIYGAYLIIDRHRFSNFAALLIIVAIMIFLIGLVAEQIALLRMANTSHE
ncbi:MAG: glycosyltransferase family 2 protein [Chloroflexi bacterium]|nr:MAG: glycosyltransferase family 2 protein [Chloroflexota bacterium]